MRARIDSLMAAFERLSAREQTMLLFLAVAILGIILGFGSWAVGRDLDNRAKRIAAKAEKLKEIAELRVDYQRRLAEQTELANQVKENQSIRILSYLEELAKKAQVDLGNASERAGNPTGSDQIREEAAEVTVQNVSLDRLHKFLQEIETGKSLVKIRQLKIKTRFDNKQKLDATITVGTFKPNATSAG